MKKFTYTEITHFDNCDGCPFKTFVDDDYNLIHSECRYDYPYKYIKCYMNEGDKDYRNKEGVLDCCPFLKQSNIVDEDN